MSQERPNDGVMAFDRHAGRIVLLAGASHGARTWTFDVCTNTWQHMNPGEEPPASSIALHETLVYDADSDRTVALTSGGQFWSYDLTTDRWTKAGQFAGVERSNIWAYPWVTALYHDPSGLVIVYNGITMWAYDVDTGALTSIRQQPDPLDHIRSLPTRKAAPLSTLLPSS